MSTLNIIDTGLETDDILSPDTFTHGVPHRAFQHLREHDPLHWQEDEDGGLWSVTRYTDVLEMNSNPEMFSSAKGIRIENMDDEELYARRTMMEMDRPEHTTYRRLVQPPFAPRYVNTYDEMLRELARGVIDRAKSHTELDFVIEIARQLPMRMLGKLLGVPDEDGPWLVSMGDALIGNSDPEFTDVPVGLVIQKTTASCLSVVHIVINSLNMLLNMQRRIVIHNPITSSHAFSNQPVKVRCFNNMTSTTSSRCWWRLGTIPHAIQWRLECTLL